MPEAPSHMQDENQSDKSLDHVLNSNGDGQVLEKHCEVLHRETASGQLNGHHHLVESGKPFEVEGQ